MELLLGWRDPVEQMRPAPVVLGLLALSSLAVVLWGLDVPYIAYPFLIIWAALIWGTVTDSPALSLRPIWRAEVVSWWELRRFADMLRAGGIVTDETQAGAVLVRCLSTGAVDRFEIRCKGYQMTADRIKSVCESNLMAFDAHEVQVSQVDNRTIRVDFIDSPIYDQLAAMDVRLSALPVARSISSIPVGETVDGSPVCVSLDSANALVAGNPGAGKSVYLSALICQLVRLSGEVVYILSPKALDFMAFEDVARVVEDVPDMLALMDALGAEELRRRDWLRAHRLKKLSDYTDEMPHITVIVDEFSVLKSATEQVEDGKRTKVRKTGQELESAIQHLVERGRYVGISFVLTTQRVSSENMSTDLRDLVSGWRVAFSLSTVESTRMVMGDRASDAPAHDIPHSARGVGWMLRGSDPIAFKGAFASDEDEWAAADAARCSRRWVV